MVEMDLLPSPKSQKYFIATPPLTVVVKFTEPLTQILSKSPLMVQVCAINPLVKHINEINMEMAYLYIFLQDSDFLQKVVC